MSPDEVKAYYRNSTPISQALRGVKRSAQDIVKEQIERNRARKNHQ